MATRLATQRNFVSIAQSDSSVDDTMTSPTHASNGEIVTTSSANGQSAPIQRVLGSQVSNTKFKHIEYYKHFEIIFNY